MEPVAIEKTTTNDTTNPKEDKPVKVPKKRGRKPKYPPDQHKITFCNKTIIIEFD
jgi:hypothetical protein